MAQPPAYDPKSLSTTSFDASLRAALDAEFAKIKKILDIVRINLAAIQRDDTQLANESVHLEALTQVVRDMLGGGAAAGVTDHGELTGRGDDDHIQYLLASGARALTGILSYASHPTFTGNTQLVDKQFVENLISGVGGIEVHSGLSGLLADDHTQYLLATGARALSGVLSYDAHPTFNADLQLIDKKYADDNFESILSNYVTETGTAFTLGSTHNGRIVRANNAADITVTAPSTGNAAGFNCLIIPVNTGRILFDDDGGATAFEKPATANLRSSEAQLPIAVNQRVVGTYHVAGGLEDASIKKMQVMVCDSTVSVAATPGFNGNFAVIPDEYDGMNLVDVSVFNLTPGTGGDSTYQISRNRAGTSVNMLSTVATIEDGEYNTLTALNQPVINNANDDVLEGDMIILTPTTVGSTAPKGLIPIYEFRRPV